LNPADHSQVIVAERLQARRGREVFAQERQQVQPASLAPLRIRDGRDLANVSDGQAMRPRARRHQLAVAITSRRRVGRAGEPCGLAEHLPLFADLVV
jgi:hypothetical protein